MSNCCLCLITLYAARPCHLLHPSADEAFESKRGVTTHQGAIETAGGSHLFTANQLIQKRHCWGLMLHRPGLCSDNTQKRTISGDRNWSLREATLSFNHFNDLLLLTAPEDPQLTESEDGSRNLTQSSFRVFHSVRTFYSYCGLWTKLPRIKTYTGLQASFIKIINMLPPALSQNCAFIDCNWLNYIRSYFEIFDNAVAWIFLVHFELTSETQTVN